jgi:hypothetical protein
LKASPLSGHPGRNFRKSLFAGRPLDKALKHLWLGNKFFMTTFLMGALQIFSAESLFARKEAKKDRDIPGRKNTKKK